MVKSKSNVGLLLLGGGLIAVALLSRKTEGGFVGGGGFDSGYSGFPLSSTDQQTPLIYNLGAENPFPSAVQYYDDTPSTIQSAGIPTISTKKQAGNSSGGLYSDLPQSELDRLFPVSKTPSGSPSGYDIAARQGLLPPSINQIISSQKGSSGGGGSTTPLTKKVQASGGSFAGESSLKDSGQAKESEKRAADLWKRISSGSNSTKKSSTKK